MDLIIKICGLKYPGNIREVASLQPDFAGFIFYPASPRFLSTADDFPTDALIGLHRTGVFVNEDFDQILKCVHDFGLDAVQLHGNEEPHLCEILRKESLIVLKAFSIAGSEDFEACSAFEEVADFFVFDTKTPQYGGSGSKFDWTMLSYYKCSVPFLLSGGLSPDDAEAIKSISHPRFAGIDLNSRFEIETGLKDISLLKKFLAAFGR